MENIPDLNITEPKPPGKRTYTAPRILSVEALEAVAATCDPPAGGFGKIIPTFCGTLGS